MSNVPKWAGIVSAVLLIIFCLWVGSKTLEVNNFTTTFDEDGKEMTVPSQPEEVNATILRLVYQVNDALMVTALGYFAARGGQYLRILDLPEWIVSVKTVTIVYGVALCTAATFYLVDGGLYTNPGTILEPLPTLFNTSCISYVGALLLGSKPAVDTAAQASRLVNKLFR